MSEFQVKNVLISGSCNSEYENFDWFGQLVAYGCENLVFIYDTTKTKILCALKGHAGRVNCVRFFDDGKIMSVCASGDFIIWQHPSLKRESLGEYLADEIQHTLWKIQSKSTLKGKNIIQFSHIEINSDEYFALMLTTKSDLNLFQIKRSDAQSPFKITLTETLDFGNNLLECSTIVKFAGNVYAAVSGSDFKIHIYEILHSQTDGCAGTLKYLNGISGHEDKVSALTFINLEDSSNSAGCFLASGSKDNYIKVWKLCENLDEQILLSAVKKNIYRIGSHYLFLESSLLGHMDSVSSIQWTFKPNQNGEIVKDHQHLILISSSLDFSIQVWEREEKSQVWMNTSRLGQVAGNKNVFFGAKMDETSRFLLSYTYQGSFYLWKRGETIRDWDAQPVVTGHFAEVTDVDLSSDDSFVVSTSIDQTTRIFAPWLANNTWNEQSRAQIHGYDINAIKCLKLKSTDDRHFCDYLVCGAQEKILRMIEPPSQFINTINSLAEKNLRLYIEDIKDEVDYLDDQKTSPNQTIYKTKTSGGYQVLGLMTKAPKPERMNFYTKEEIEDMEETIEDVEIPYDYTTPAIEDYLVKHTLWPEINKMYGHGFEIESIAVTKDGEKIASTCLSQVAKHSSIIIWNPRTYLVEQELEGHEFTVLQLKFSDCGNWLVSVSRDRCIGIWGKNATTNKFEKRLIQTIHTRLVFCVGITHDSKFIITGSRDKTIKIFALHPELEGDNILQEVCSKKFKESVTAATFSRYFYNQKEQNLGETYVFLIGQEDGTVECSSFDPASKSITTIGKISDNLAHSNKVNKIIAGPRNTSGNVLVASCSDDHTLRVYEYPI